MSEPRQPATGRGVTLEASEEACTACMPEASAINDPDVAELSRVAKHRSRRKEKAMLTGWKQYRLGEIASFKNGLNFTRSDAGEAIKIVGVSDFKNRAQLDGTERLATVQVTGVVRDTELLKSGDLLFVRSNGNKELIGRCLYFPNVQERLAFSGFTIRGRVETTVLDPLFASYLMRSQLVLDQIFLGGSGTNISNLSQEILSNISVQVPCLIEQRRIAHVLSIWDQAISTMERLIANSQRRKRALMRSLLSGRRRFPNLKEKWHYVDFDSVFVRVIRKNAINDVNVLTISGEHGLISQRDYFSKSVAGASLTGYTLLKRLDFAYNKSYSAGYPMGAIKPLLAYETGIVSSLYLCFRLREDVDADFDFFRHYFEAGLLNQEIEGIAQEGARNHGLLNVSVTDFFKLRLHIPSGPEQRQIAEVINVAEADKRRLDAQLRSLRLEKQALMQQLLTGKRRLKLSEAVSEEQV